LLFTKNGKKSKIKQRLTEIELEVIAGQTIEKQTGAERFKL
jgi:hypothetical protein